MKKSNHQPYTFHSIAEMNKALGMPPPLHPLIALNDYKNITADISDIVKGMLMDFYKISYKRNLSGKIKYGQHYYDFNEGGLSFISPNQLIAEDESNGECDGFTLLIHPDFLRGYSLTTTIKNYGFFSYSANEALQLSEKEKETVLGIFKNIQDELEQRLDNFSQDVIISQIELLLNYSNRFYNRQFITRKAVNNSLLTQMEKLLDDFFTTQEGLPTVHYLADKLNVSPTYLSDLLRNLTGMNAQQHIHQKLIEKAKEILSTGNLSVAEVAYQLGFEHPQSFSKIFKRKTNLTPIEFKQSFN
ncbi:helix-turn-helix domain-containing protein [Runella sp.]|uniref:helix-turn-helix domain-containing protein n=1 Tax=Runella sp. TaxID=1960881 RepID=UPI003D1329F4